MNEEEFKRKYLEYPLKVYDIFKEYYGEDRVDIQGLPAYSEEVNEDIINTFILVYFPEVKVTNEKDKSTIIKELYVKVRINKKGKLKETFTFNRAKYTIQEWESDYMHSHARTIYKIDPSIFSTVCTGSGPIKNTIDSLKLNYNEDLWGLFCLELDRYTQVESVEGIPYHKLENIGISDFKVRLNYIHESFNLYNNTFNFTSFLEYILKSNILRFAYYNNSYYLGMSDKDYILKVSSAFIIWYNKNKYYEKYNLDALLNKNILFKAFLDSKGELKTRYDFNYSVSLNNSIGKKVCTFKGKEITLSKDNDWYNDDNNILILNTKILGNLLISILKVVNFNYGRESN